MYYISHQAAPLKPTAVDHYIILHMKAPGQYRHCFDVDFQIIKTIKSHREKNHSNHHKPTHHSFLWHGSLFLFQGHLTSISPPYQSRESISDWCTKALWKLWIALIHWGCSLNICTVNAFTIFAFYLQSNREHNKLCSLQTYCTTAVE